MSLRETLTQKQRSSLIPVPASFVHAVDIVAPLVFIDPGRRRRKAVEEFHHLIMRAFDQVVGNRMIEPARLQADVKRVDQLIDDADSDSILRRCSLDITCKTEYS